MTGDISSLRTSVILISEGVVLAMWMGICPGWILLMCTDHTNFPHSINSPAYHSLTSRHIVHSAPFSFFNETSLGPSVGYLPFLQALSEANDTLGLSPIWRVKNKELLKYLSSSLTRYFMSSLLLVIRLNAKILHKVASSSSFMKGS